MEPDDLRNNNVEPLQLDEYVEDDPLPELTISATLPPLEDSIIEASVLDCDTWSASAGSDSLPDDEDEVELMLHASTPTYLDRIDLEEYTSAGGVEAEIGARRVTFQDITKPYLARISSHHNYRKFLELVQAEEAQIDASPDSGINELQHLSAEEQERQREEWRNELIKIEEEIQTLRHVLASKVKASQELKRKLGITVWKEFQDDMNQGLRNVKESNVYQKTESALKGTAEKATTLLGGLGSNLSMRIGQLKNSDSFRSLEERVGSAYENVKTKVGTSRSNSTQSFDEALRETEVKKTSNGTPPTTPTVPEEKPVS